MESAFVLAILAFPALAVLLLGLRAWVYRPWSEDATVAIVAAAFGGSTSGSLSAAASLIRSGQAEIRVPIGSWFAVAHHSFDWSLIADRLSIPFATFAAVLLGLVADGLACP